MEIYEFYTTNHDQKCKQLEQWDLDTGNEIGLLSLIEFEQNLIWDFCETKSLVKISVLEGTIGQIVGPQNKRSFSKACQ